MLTGPDAAGQRAAIARDRRDSTPACEIVGFEDQLADPRDHEQRVSKRSFGLASGAAVTKLRTGSQESGSGQGLNALSSYLPLGTLRGR